MFRMLECNTTRSRLRQFASSAGFAGVHAGPEARAEGGE